jgi:hypothetical protein
MLGAENTLRDASEMADINVARVQTLVRNIYEIVAELEAMFAGRHFTPDGHMVGSIGEFLAAHHYDLTLLPPSTECHDATATTGERVQIKTTQGERIAIDSCPDFLLVLKLKPDGTVEEVYCGEGRQVWALVKDKKRPKTGQYQVTLSSLRALAELPGGEPKFKRVR